jgi:hypothetical protein
MHQVAEGLLVLLVQSSSHDTYSNASSCALLGRSKWARCGVPSDFELSVKQQTKLISAVLRAERQSSSAQSDYRSSAQRSD